jgi:2,4-dienoyl-CoA reductase-like NADH-dependent reductase (Old Yellow Enzyme family)
MAELFSPFDLAGLSLPNRIVMAPMTRSRSPDDVADVHTALYYTQRATAGLIISEGTPVSNEGQGYLYNPGIFTPQQVAGWRLVTDSVRAANGRMFAQLWHVGRVSHPSIQNDRRDPVGPSDLRADAMAFGFGEDGAPGFVRAGTPRALPTEEVARVVSDFAQAARNAIDAGFHGVELHGANGYLLDQFLNPDINTRTDRYGGSIENRMRFILETVDAVAAAIGEACVGIRLSPWGIVNGGSQFEDTEELFLALGERLGERSLAYVHVMDQTGLWNLPNRMEPTSELIQRMLELWRPHMGKTALILAGGMTRERADRLIGEGVIDLAGFGQPFIANPDLPARLRNGWPLEVADHATYYTGGLRGYLDYPAYRDEQAMNP